MKSIIRFKEFKDNWNQTTFENVFNFERPEKYIVRNSEYLKIGNPVLTANKSFILGYTNEKDLYDKGPCILFDDFTLDSKYVDFPFKVNSTAIKILTSKTKLNLKFCYYLLCATHILQQGHSRHYISVVQPKSVYVPEENEAKKIALLLDSFDKEINALNIKIKKMKFIKKTLIEMMFTTDSRVPRTRFKDYSSDWEEIRFSSIAKLERGLTYSPSDITNNGIRVLRSSNIYEDKFKTYEDDVFVKKSCINIPYIKNGDILITSANGSSKLVGKHAVIKGVPDNSCVQGGFMLKATTKYPYFLNASMNSEWYVNFIDTYVAGGNGSIGNLNKNDLNNFEFFNPKDLSEQEKIGKLFKSLDELIDLFELKSQKLVFVKDGFVEKIFY